MHISRKNFDRLVEDAIASLPEEFARWIDEVPIIVEDAPRKRDLPNPDPDEDSEEDSGDPVGLYHGTALPDQLQNSGHLPPRIFIYRRPLMEACNSREQLAEEIRKTLIHELGHHAGMDEEQLQQLGYGPLEEEADDAIQWDLEDDEPQ